MHVDIRIMAFVDVWLIGANGKELAGQGGAVLQMMAVGNAGREAGDVAGSEQSLAIFFDQHRLTGQHYQHFDTARRTAEQQVAEQEHEREVEAELQHLTASLRKPRGTR